MVMFGPFGWRWYLSMVWRCFIKKHFYCRVIILNGTIFSIFGWSGFSFCLCYVCHLLSSSSHFPCEIHTRQERWHRLVLRNRSQVASFCFLFFPFLVHHLSFSTFFLNLIFFFSAHFQTYSLIIKPKIKNILFSYLCKAIYLGPYLQLQLCSSLWILLWSTLTN